MHSRQFMKGSKVGPGNHRDLRNRYQFLGGATGTWKVTRLSPYRGEGLPMVDRINVANRASSQLSPDFKWDLHGFTSNVRYASAQEVAALKSHQPALVRPEATCAALILIKKSTAWWSLAQDERRAIFEETSHHTAIGLGHCSPIAPPPGYRGRI